MMARITSRFDTSATQIPLISHRLERIMAASGHEKGSHAYKALLWSGVAEAQIDQRRQRRADGGQKGHGAPPGRSRSGASRPPCAQTRPAPRHDQQVTQRAVVVASSGRQPHPRQVGQVRTVTPSGMT
jgi:hypothetical protein